MEPSEFLKEDNDEPGSTKSARHKLATLNPTPIRLKDYEYTENTPYVFVENGNGPYQNTKNVLKHFNLSMLKDKRVLLKPNIGRIAKINSGIVTHPEVVAAAIDVFREAGAIVAVAESPISGVKTMKAFESAGIKRIAEERECLLIDMDERAFVEVPVPNGKAIFSLKICPEIFEFDVIVSIPVIKMHMHTGVTLSVKNMKGCLWRRSKVDLHMLAPVEGYEEKPLDVAISDLSGVLKPHLALIDGTVCMEGLGPSAGKPRPLDVIIASLDPFAADSVACELIGMNAKEVPHLRLGSMRGYGEIDITRINVRPHNWKSLKTIFKRPPSDLSAEFPDVQIFDKNSCSACQSTLFLFLKRYGKVILEYFDENEIPKFAIGKGHHTLPENTFCIGNCTAKHRKKCPFIPGCPPVGSEILSAITGKPAIDEQDGHSDKEE